MTSLNPGVTYYVRAYGTNMAGTKYGSAVSFTTTSDSSITDYDGNIYPAVTIGDQTWMAENLRVTHFADGTPIPFIEEATEWPTTSEDSVKAYCWYENNSLNSVTYGALYTWSAAMNGEESSDINPSGIQGVCPAGWHLPSDAEWKQLEVFLGMDIGQANGTEWRGTVEGGKLKAEGTTHWDSPNFGATNESGFSALPGGARLLDGIFNGLGSNAFFHTSAENESLNFWGRGLFSGNAQVRRASFYKCAGSSVRCVKDQ
jgi:uncharacterized protein (TIGR02145 family)